jgi:TolA-binding protein
MMVPPLSKIKLPYFIITAFMLLPVAVGYSQMPVIVENSTLDYDLKIVYNLQRIGNFKSALNYLDMLKARYGDDARILNLYKNIYLEAKMYTDLESVIRKQIAKSPDNPIYLAELGNARFLQDDSGGADSLWALALEKGETNQSVYIYVANYKLRYGDYEGAAETYLSGRKRFNIPELFSPELANIYESQRNYPAAVKEYLIRLVKTPERFLSSSPKILGMVEDTEDVDAIIGAVKEMIGRHKTSDVLHEVLGDIYIKTGKMRLALETYKDLGKDKKDDGESLYKFAERCVDFKAYDTAIEAIDQYLATSSKLRRNDMALLLKGGALKQAGRDDPALAVLQGIFQTARDTRIRGEAGYLTGIIHAENNLCEQALTVWEKSLGFLGHSDIREMMIFEMAQCHLQLGSYPTAESLLTIIAGGNNNSEIIQKSQFLLGDLDLFKGDYQGAHDAYINIIKTYPRGDFANDAIARVSVLSTIGIDSSGIMADNSLLDLYADAAEAQMLGNLDEAASLLLSEKMANSPIGEQALFYAGAIYSDAELRDKAINALKTYIQKYPEGFFLDRVYLKLGDQYIINPETYELGKEAYNMILEAFQEGPVTELARERLRQLESQDKIG